MKTRCGFVSNSSSSSFVIYGFDYNTGCALYDLVEDIIEKDGSRDLEDEGLAYYIGEYLGKYGIDHYHYDYDNEDLCSIGCELREGSEEEFLESLMEAKAVLRKFDEEHGTKLADKAKIMSDCTTGR